jgi:hypothetical protein
VMQEITLLTEQIIRESSGEEKQRLEKVYRHAITVP